MFELKIENASGRIVNLNDGERYEVISVSGMTPPSASLFTSKSPNKKGVMYNGSSLNERIVVIEVKLHGDIEQSRNALYEWVDPEQYAKIHYRNDTKNVYCEGYVETCEIDIFTDNEVVNIEVLCPSPYLNDMQEIVTEITNLLKQFTFPFAIDAAGVPFSTILDTNATSIYNDGAETGAQFVIRCKGEVKNIRIYEDAQAAVEFRINSTFSDGWIIILDTDASPKTCKGYKPDGTEVNLMRYVGANPAWLSLRKGHNRFGFTADSGGRYMELSVGFRTKYTGV